MADFSTSREVYLKQRLPRRPLLITAIVVSAMTSLRVAIPVLLGGAPDGSFLELYWIVMAILLVAWLAAEPGVPVENRPSFDHGYLHWATFPILAMHEQFVSRRWRGIALVLGLLLIQLAPFLVWVIADSFV